MSEYKLPVVTTETRSSLQRDMISDASFEENTLRRYEIENPEVVNWLSAFVVRLPGECQKPALYSALLTMRLLESQGEADALKKVYDGNQTPQS